MPSLSCRVGLTLWILCISYLAVSPGASAREERQAEASSRDVQLPRPLVDLIEREYKDFLAKQNLLPKDGIRRSLLKAEVELRQKPETANSPLEDDFIVATPIGGGVVDLDEMVKLNRGVFLIDVRAKTEAGDQPPSLRVFFVSGSKKRILGRDEVGSGCNQFMEITKAYNQDWLPHGLEVYTADQRYVSVLAGTYVFVNFSTEALGVASVRILDSRFANLMCEAK